MLLILNNIQCIHISVSILKAFKQHFFLTQNTLNGFKQAFQNESSQIDL